MDASMTSLPDDQYPLAPGEFLLPDFTGQSLRQVVAESEKLGLDSLVDGTGRVVSQSPSPGTHVRPGARIRFRLSLN
jgi:beta-lactam-binding protein with PASTA domain